MQDRFFWAALHVNLEIGPRSLFYLYRHFSNGKAVFKASPGEIRLVPGLSPKVAEKIINQRHLVHAERIAEELIAKKIKVTLLDDRDYPRQLAEIADPPVLVYTRGMLPSPEMPLLAIVGARQASSYGRMVARKLAQDLTHRGWGIVSGMARGIDTAAHEGALAGNGYTLAVFGCGINVCYPRENEKLYHRIETNGCLLSEFPPEAGPLSKNFPIRNRIISGCTYGTLVVEAKERSGALITAFFALEQGRDVFAVPGMITSAQSRGTHNLIKQGAKLVETVDDILTEFPYLNLRISDEPQIKKELSLPSEEAAVMKFLNLEPAHIDQLSEVTGMPVQIINGLLTLLELKGLVRRLPGQYYICTDLNLPD